MPEKRQLSEGEKQAILQHHGRRCFVDGAPIFEEDPVEYHHIRPYTEGGPSTPDNIAPVCKQHHLTIGTMSLQEYRDKLELANFFEGDPKYLDDVILKKKGQYGQQTRYEICDNVISLYFRNSKNDYPLHICPTTGWYYFYATLPVDYVENDEELQPRSLRGCVP